MKLTDYIKEHHNGNISAFAKANGYHITQVQRHIDQDGEYNNGKPYFKKYLNKAKPTTK